MADTTYAVKINDEVKEKLQKLIDESNLSSKDFFADMISQFELASVKKQTPLLTADIDELMKLTTRINNIFINVGERISILQETCFQDIENATKEKESLIGLLQQQIESFKQDSVKTKMQVNELASENETLKKAIDSTEKKYISETNQLKEVNQKNNEIMASYNEKIDTLSGLVSEYKSFSDENKVLKDELAKMQKNNAQLQQENENLNLLLTKNQLLVDELDKKYQQDIEYQREKLELSRDRMLLEQREKYSQEVDEIRSSYAEKINQLLQISSTKKETKKKPELNPKNIQEIKP